MLTRTGLISNLKLAFKWLIFEVNSMPIYEYECQACGFRHEALQKMSDSPLTDCPQCKQSQLKKLVSAAAFRLKGGGWYETDFKSGDKKNLANSESAKVKSEGSSAKTDKTQSDSGNKPNKTETKSDSTSSTKQSSAN